LKYSCNKDGDGEWFLYSSARSTAIPKEFFSSVSNVPYETIKIDNKTCEVLEESRELFNNVMSNTNNSINE